MQLNEVEIVSSAATHVGKVRQDNQDSLKVCSTDNHHSDSTGFLYGIADGMGGYAHGGVASTVALETLFETYYEAKKESPSQKIRVGIQNANLNVYKTAQTMASGKMGTTLTAVSVDHQTLTIGHVGDSRAYLIRDNKSKCLTNDHTRVGELVRMKLLTPEKVRTHVQRSVLDKCLGIGLFVQPDVFEVPVQDGDKILLCTDGLWSVIDDHEFGSFISTVKSEEVCDSLVNLAMERDSDDNISILLIDLHKLSKKKPAEQKKSKWHFPSMLSKLVKGH